MIRRYIIVSAWVGLTASGMSAADSRPDVNAILKRSQAINSAATTYQANMVISMSMGSMGSMMMKMDIQMIPPKGKMHVKVSPTGQATGKMQIGVLMASMEAFDDGKNTYLYKPAMGTYTKNKHSELKRDPNQFALMSATNASFRYVRDDNVNGTPVIVVEPIRAGRGNVQLFIDKRTGRMKQFRMHGSNAGPDGKPMEMNMTMVVKKEVLNGSIPDSAFVFTPPAGSKEVQGPGRSVIPGLGGIGGQ